MDAETKLKLILVQHILDLKESPRVHRKCIICSIIECPYGCFEHFDKKGCPKCHKALKLL